MVKSPYGLLGVIAAFAVSVAAFAFSGAALHAQDEIAIGEYASLTGGNATFGQSSHAGTQLAVDEVNAAGGVLGKKIKLVTADDQSLPGHAGPIVTKFISGDKVVAVLGEVTSSKSLEAAPICQQNKIPMISPGSTNPKVTAVGDYIFRVCYIDPFQGEVMAKFALGKGWKKIAVLTDTKEQYSLSLAGAFKESFTKNGGTIANEQSFSTGDRDFKAQITALKEAQPDAIFVPGYYGEVSLIARQARQLGLDAPLLGGDGWEGEALIKIGGKAIEGGFFTDHFSGQEQVPVIQDFVKKYKEKYGMVPDAMGALGYDSAMLLIEAMKRAGTTDSEKLRDAIAATKDYQGVTGAISLDAQRNASKPAVIITISSGDYKFVESVNP